jgi:glucose/arabinose dehydrogenase
VSAFAFDREGRLWVATAAAKDVGTDGVYVVARAGAPAVRVIGGLHTPLGLLWVDSTLYVASTGRVDAYDMLADAAFARHRTILTLPTGVGESNALAAAPDGRLVLGISAPCDACTPSSPYSAAVVSFRRDGSDLRVVASRIRAPVGLAYVPGTTDLLATMDQRDALGTKTPGDWVGLVRAGQDWRFPGCYGQGGSACAGVPAPVAVLERHGGVDGLAILPRGLAAAPGPSAIVAEWATAKVVQVGLTTRGATYTGEVTPFLTGIAHPSAVIAGPGGTVLVGDWSDGRIYRIASRDS